MRLESLLIGGLQRLKEMLRLPGVVPVEAPVAPKGEGRQLRASESVNSKILLLGLNILKKNLLSGNEPGLRVSVVYAFFDGFRQNSHMSGIVREHGGRAVNNHKPNLESKG